MTSSPTDSNAMVFHNSFDISEFLAYLLPGSLVLIALHYIFGTTLTSMFADLMAPLSSSAGVVALVSYFAAALAAGHITSIWTRWIMRPLSRKINGEARQLAFGDVPRGFYSTELICAIKERFTLIFKLPPDNPNVRLSAPRLVRSYVLQYCPSAAIIRGHIVRARSLCGNLTLPMILFSLILVFRGQWLGSLIFIATAVALLYKEADLDEREWKEIYTGFLAVHPVVSGTATE